MTLDQSLLDRVQKLLALATSPNVHEAAAAAARAQRLIAEHRLEDWLRATSSEIDPIEDARDEPLETARRLRKWKIALASALAEVNGCVAYTLASHDTESIVLVGRASDRAAVRQLWDWLLKRIEWLSATEGAGRSRDWHEAFRVGAVQTIALRLAETQGAVEQAVEPGALVRVDAAMEAHRAALDGFVSANLKLGKGRSLNVRADGFRQGKASASKLPLPKPGGAG